MALTKQKKQEIVADVADLLSSSKMTVIASYRGTTVKDMQALRRQATENGTSILVVKNRLVIQAIKGDEKLKQVDTSKITGQLMYAFNSEDEVAPAQTLAKFQKTNPNVEFIGAITSDGLLVEPEDVKALASLPSKDQLRAQVVGTLAAPLSGFVNVVAGNVRGVLNVLNSRAESIK